jgi:arginine decarboxylase
MATIRVVWGTATGPTAMASYDAALAAANVHDYNLVTVSSVIPAEATVDPVGTAPDLGPAGEALTVVQSRRTVGPEEAGPASAGIGWSREPDGPGIFYEAGGDDPEDVRRRICEGLADGRRLREWDFDAEEVVVKTADADPDAYTTTVVVAVYGDSWPLL